MARALAFAALACAVLLLAAPAHGEFRRALRTRASEWRAHRALARALLLRGVVMGCKHGGGESRWRPPQPAATPLSVSHDAPLSLSLAHANANHPPPPTTNKQTTQTARSSGTGVDSIQMRQNALENTASGAILRAVRGDQSSSSAADVIGGAASGVNVKSVPLYYLENAQDGAYFNSGGDAGEGASVGGYDLSGKKK